MARPRARPAGLSEELIERAHEWAERSCADQDLPIKITDPATVAKVAAILAPAIAAQRQSRERHESAG